MADPEHRSLERRFFHHGAIVDKYILYNVL